ncbi:hypothetical protein X797_005797 [Metarhizium robertsii]|uniref:Uncharacterized protein n=1 Tax=Metarhizium robertsii TaxID=568076 RepID=A0A014PB28_9HYPO|nr:hypothetical protein X797_005797 [Metarhizium robertsii]
MYLSWFLSQVWPKPTGLKWCMAGPPISASIRSGDHASAAGSMNICLNKSAFDSGRRVNMVAAQIVGAWPTKKRLGRAQCHGQRDSLSHGRIKRLDTLNDNTRRSQARVVCDSSSSKTALHAHPRLHH